MKPSYYNYIVEDGDRAVFFNGITELLFDVPLKNRSKYESILAAPDDYIGVFDSFLKKMKSNGFIIEEETDEWERLEYKYRRLRNESSYHLMLLPTYQCNLRCWYCIQNHQDLIMSEETISEIKRLIENTINDPTIKTLRLSWFGGEPLLCYDTVLSLTSYSKELCERHKKVFLCDITTNGILLNRQKIEALRNVGVAFYQITIDGTKEIHDRIKFLGEESAYERSIENINIIAETTRCTLRFNYTKETLDPDGILKDLDSRIPKKVRDNIKFLIYKVWQEETMSIDYDEVVRLASLSAKAGIRSELPTTGLCYADSRHFTCIFPNGRVEKCDNESPEAARGHLSEDGITWEGDTSFHVTAFLDSRFPCRNCRHLPLCWGPCVAKRERMIRDYGIGRCQYEDKEAEMREILLNMYRNASNCLPVKL